MNILNRIVSAYLETAELKAISQEPMYMKDWKKSLEDFLKMTGKKVLHHKGLVSHHQALEKANLEFGKYMIARHDEANSVDEDFGKVISENINKLTK